MKWLRWILAALVGLPLLALVLLLLAGQREGAGRTVARVDIARSPAQVFTHLEDEKLLKSWTGATSVEMLTPGGLRPGARWRFVAEAGGQRTEVEGEVTAIERSRFLGLVLKSAPGASVGFKELVEYRLESRDQGTRLTVTGDTHFEGFVLRLLEPLITQAAQRQLEASLARLKGQVEAGPATPTHGSKSGPNKGLWIVA